MMGVYIKGMEMPPNCFLCKLSFMSGERLFCSAMKNEEVLRAKIDSNCPLIELPPHGRLIDGDALENEVQMRLSECNKYDNQFQKPYEVMRAITLAPTVIESEGD